MPWWRPGNALRMSTGAPGRSTGGARGPRPGDRAGGGRRWTAMHRPWSRQRGGMPGEHVRPAGAGTHSGRGLDRHDVDAVPAGQGGGPGVGASAEVEDSHAGPVSQVTGDRGAPFAERVRRQLAGRLEGRCGGVAVAGAGHGLAGLPGGVAGDLDEVSIGVADVDAGDGPRAPVRGTGPSSTGTCWASRWARTSPGGVVVIRHWSALPRVGWAACGVTPARPDAG